MISGQTLRVRPEEKPVSTLGSSPRACFFRIMLKGPGFWFMLETHRKEATSITFARSRLALSRLALMTGLLSAPASAESVPFNCIILPGEEAASIMVTNSLAGDASCIVTCKFSTSKYDNNPQITCAKPVPAGKEVEMCRLSSGADKMLKLTEGQAECTK